MQTNHYLIFRQAIQAAVKYTERGALLTTHYMAEAEAVCDHVAIVASGRLRWVPVQSQYLSPTFLDRELLFTTNCWCPSPLEEEIKGRVFFLFPELGALVPFNIWKASLVKTVYWKWRWRNSFRGASPHRDPETLPPGCSAGKVKDISGWGDRYEDFPVRVT